LSKTGAAVIFTVSTDVAIFGELFSTRWFGRRDGRVSAENVSGMVMTGKVIDNSLLSMSSEAGTPSGASSR
jgi:hypothetical protein